MTAPLDRRALLALGATAALTVGGTHAWPRLRPLAYEDVPGISGLRRLAGSPSLSASGPATIGLDAPRPATPRPADPVTAAHGATDAPVPVTLFTAGGCPYCAPQAERLATLGPAPALRPLALFGHTSERAARALIAAGPASWPLHDRLVGSAFRTEDAFIHAIATDALGPSGADALLTRMDAPETTRVLAQNHALASALAIPGTPATLIGRTLALGLTRATTLARILSDEAARP